MWFDRRHVSDRTLARLVDGELTGRRVASVSRHLTECASCTARHHALSRASHRLRALTEPGETPGDVTALRARLKARLATERRSQPESEFARGWMTPLTVLACTGMVVVALIAGPGKRADVATIISETASGHSGSGMLPDPSLTPGSVDRTSATELCSPGRRPARTIAVSVRQAVLRAYGMEHVPIGEYELDYLITPELGGATDRENLWPERYGSRTWNARVKDDLERLLPRMVCEGRLELAVAQHEIAADWIAAYQKYFHTSTPLTTYATTLDDDDTIVETMRFVAVEQLARR